MAKSDEVTVAKINAAIRILEWAKDDIEPGIGGNPHQLHIALGRAFTTLYEMVSEAVGTPPTADEEGEARP